jgi:glycerol-3-phosphate acyltransferase PlsY
VSTLLLDAAKGALPTLARAALVGLADRVSRRDRGDARSRLPRAAGIRRRQGCRDRSGRCARALSLRASGWRLAWAIVFVTLRYASVASLAAGAVFLIAAVALDQPWPVIAFAALAFGFVALRHRANIARLRSGTEPRARLRRATSEPGS